MVRPEVEPATDSAEPATSAVVVAGTTGAGTAGAGAGWVCMALGCGFGRLS